MNCVQESSEADFAVAPNSNLPETKTLAPTVTIRSNRVPPPGQAKADTVLTPIYPRSSADAGRSQFVRRINPSVLANPYAPSTVDDSRQRNWSVTQRHRFAGAWLIVSGILHFFVINALTEFTSLTRLDWTPLVLTGLGFLVAIQLRIAIAFTRLIGSFTLIGLVLTSILLIVGFGDGGGLSYGATTVTDPKPWQVLLLLATIAATMIPPWWTLQRALAGNNRVHPSTRAGRVGH